MADKTKLISELRQRVAHLPSLPDEPDFNTSEETLIRYLKSRDWKLEEAAKMLIDSIEYRRQTRPQIMDCSWCHNRPGFHSLRQVGHDEAGRPVFYSSFVQASTYKNSADDSITHVTYLIENAKRSMGPGVFTCVFVIDFTGMTLSSCNPKLGYSMTNVVSNHYPERLGLMVFINHNAVFQGVWKAMKQFLHPNTVAKVKMARSKAKVAEIFSHLFSPELSAWMQEEIALNKHKPLSRTQLEFWNPLQEGQQHDPRGCESYVKKYLDTFPKTLQSNGGSQQQETITSSAKTSPEKTCASQDGTPPEITRRVHKPHPNIVDRMSGLRLERVALSKEEELEWQQAQSAMEAAETRRARDGEEDVLASELEIPSDLQIPPSALPLGAST
ncbi:hypothetical protein ACOMHN_011003 [Nucella lapillus]